MRKAGGIAGVLAVAALAGCGPGGGGGKAELSPKEACLQSLDPAKGVDLCKSAMATEPDATALRLRLALLRLKAGQLPAARQAYQVVASQNPQNADAAFGLGLTLQFIGEPGGARRKQQAAAMDPGVVARFGGYGFDAVDLMLFDTEPLIVGGQSPADDKAMIPREPRLKQGLSVNVRCLVPLKGKLHDCVPVTPLAPDQAVFGQAAVKILSAIKAEPARDKGAPVADAPLFMTYVFWPQDQT